MNWFNLSLAIIPTFVSPLGQQNVFRSQLLHLLSVANISYSQLEFSPYSETAKILINKTRIILSTKKDPYQQIETLQGILKIATIEEKEIDLIDLDSKHPYASFKNN